MDITGLLKVSHFLYPCLIISLSNHKVSKRFWILRGEKKIMNDVE